MAQIAPARRCDEPTLRMLLLGDTGACAGPLWRRVGLRVQTLRWVASSGAPAPPPR